MSRWNGKTLLKREIDMVIDSNAFLVGWGVHCSHQSTGDPWMSQESSMHINCLKLLAATLVVKPFAKTKTKISLALRINNTTAVAYINNLEKTVSRKLILLTQNLWMWCLERNIHITAQYLPGIQNTVADAESRTMTDRSDWKLNPSIFLKINQLFGPMEVDLFATRLTAQCQCYFSWQPDPSAEATDAFLQSWTNMRCYTNPPWNLIGRTLAQVQSQQVRIVLVAPVWKAQPWYPTFLGMLIDYLQLIPTYPETMLNLSPTMALPNHPRLATWNISGINTEAMTFLKKL